MFDAKRIKEIIDAIEEVWTMLPTKQFGELLYLITKRNSHYYAMGDNEFVDRLTAFKKTLIEENTRMNERLAKLKE